MELTIDEVIRTTKHHPMKQNMQDVNYLIAYPKNSLLKETCEYKWGGLLKFLCLISINMDKHTIKLPSKLAGLLFPYQMTSHQHQQ